MHQLRAVGARGQRGEENSQKGNVVRHGAATGSRQETFAMAVEAACQLVMYDAKEL
jgi:hypothetical protein